MHRRSFAHPHGPTSVVCVRVCVCACVCVFVCACICCQTGDARLSQLDVSSQIVSNQLENERRYWQSKVERNKTRLATVKRRNQHRAHTKARGSPPRRSEPANGALDADTPAVPNEPIS